MSGNLVYVLDDDEDVRLSLDAMLSASGYQVLSYATADGFLAKCETNPPTCAVIDVRMPGISGIELLAIMQQRDWNFRIIVITGHGDITMAVKAMKLGAADFLTKPFAPDQLISAIENRKSDRTPIFERNLLIPTVVSPPLQTKSRLAILSPREREILGLVRKGMSSKDIAENLEISPATVNNHRTQIRDKLNAKSLAHLLSMFSDNDF